MSNAGRCRASRDDSAPVALPCCGGSSHATCLMMYNSWMRHQPSISEGSAGGGQSCAPALEDESSASSSSSAFVPVSSEKIKQVKSTLKAARLSSAINGGEMQVEERGSHEPQLCFVLSADKWGCKAKPVRSTWLRLLHTVNVNLV